MPIADILFSFGGDGIIISSSSSSSPLSGGQMYFYSSSSGEGGKSASGGKSPEGILGSGFRFGFEFPRRGEGDVLVEVSAAVAVAVPAGAEHCLSCLLSTCLPLPLKDLTPAPPSSHLICSSSCWLSGLPLARATSWAHCLCLCVAACACQRGNELYSQSS